MNTKHETLALDGYRAAAQELARTGNAYQKGVTITVTLAPISAAMIDSLITTGLYGQSRSAVCREFVYRALRDFDTRRLAGDLPEPRKGP